MEGDQKPDHIDGMQFSGLEVLAHGGRSAVSSDPAVQNPKAGGTKQKEHAQSCVHASSPSESTGLALCGARSLHWGRPESKSPGPGLHTACRSKRADGNPRAAARSSRASCRSQDRDPDIRTFGFRSPDSPRGPKVLRIPTGGPRTCASGVCAV